MPCPGECPARAKRPRSPTSFAISTLAGHSEQTAAGRGQPGQPRTGARLTLVHFIARPADLHRREQDPLYRTGSRRFRRNRGRQAGCVARRERHRRRKSSSRAVIRRPPWLAVAAAHGRRPGCRRRPLADEDEYWQEQSGFFEDVAAPDAAGGDAAEYHAGRIHRHAAAQRGWKRARHFTSLVGLVTLGRQWRYF